MNDRKSLFPGLLCFQQLFDKLMIVDTEFTDLFACFFPFETGCRLTDFDQCIGCTAQGTQYHDLLLRVCGNQFGHFMHTLRFAYRRAPEFHNFHAILFCDRKYTNENATADFKTGWRLIFLLDYLFTIFWLYSLLFSITWIT